MSAAVKDLMLATAVAIGLAWALVQWWAAEC